ncbi:fish-egg lectin-like [Anomaloglossus baeobatrachus]|uniref:fish-egg lectin-like n=1 Tax=Anomaloglossus baeobatrachus TaxID=238106 RepID=UPI003F50BE7A
MSFILSLILLCVGVSVIDAKYQCFLISGTLKQIDAGAGQVYGVNNDGNVFFYANNNWQQFPGQLVHVSVGPAGVWGVNNATNVFKLRNNMWWSVTGLLKQVDAGGDQFLGGVDALYNVFCLRQSCTTSKASMVQFTNLDGNLKYYSCGPFGCWGVNSTNYIFFRQNVSPEACEGTQWQQVNGRLIQLEVGTDGSVFGVNDAGNPFRREGISAQNPTGTSWSRIQLAASFKHVTYDAGYLWLLAQNGAIHRCYDQN